MNFTNLLKLSYWFSLQPPEMAARSFLIGEIAVLVMFAAGVALKMYAKTLRQDPPRARLTGRLGSAVIGFSVVVFIWLLLKNETVYLLGARFWLPVILAAFGAWGWRLISRFRKTSVHEREATRKSAEFRKYLPK